MADRKITIEIIGDASSLERAFRQSSSSGQRFESTMSKFGKTAAFAASGAALGGLTVALHAGISEWQQSAQVAAQTEAVLKSTGGVANVSAKQIDDLANSLLRKTGIDDEAIKSGANLLLTFTNIRNEAGRGNDIFNQSTKVITDMSVALGQDMKSSALQLGKALNDPVRGISTLRRVGVAFTEQQKEQIKALVDSGQTMKAQKIILAELNKEFGGSAESVGKTLPGQINILKEEFNNLAAQGVQVAIDKFEELRPTLETLAETIGGFMDVIRPLATLMFDVIVTPMKIVADLLRGDWSQAWNDAKKPVQDFIDLLAGVWNHVSEPLGQIGAFFEALPGRIAATLTTLLSSALSPFQTAFTTARNWVGEKVNEITGFFTALPGRIAATLGNLASSALAPFKTAFTTAADWVGGRVDAIVGWFTALPGRLTAAAGAIQGGAATIGRAIYTGVTTALASFGRAVAAIIVQPINSVIDAINAIKIPGFSFGGVHVPFVGTIGAFDFPSIDPIPGDIPHLASGGLVEQTGLAVVHRGEIFSGVRNQAGFGTTIHVHVAGSVVTERQLVDAIHDGLNRKLRNGGSLLLGT